MGLPSHNAAKVNKHNVESVSGALFHPICLLSHEGVWRVSGIISDPKSRKDRVLVLIFDGLDT